VTALSQGPDSFRSRGADVQLEVPPGTVLDLHTSNGKIAAIGDVGNVNASSSNGKIDVEGSKGKLKLHSTNGAITVVGGAGKIDVETSNGAIDVKAARALVDARTSNGSIHFEGNLAEGDNTFRSSNGKITLLLPSDASFRLEADTSNGKIRSDFLPGTSKGKEGQHLSGAVGDHPDASITAKTSNSSIEIRKK
jgi:DUF4097 and DUF4098 domain-containing protein YvlB